MPNNTLSTTASNNALSVFSSAEAFESAQRMAKLLSSSSLVPAEYRNNIANATIALEMAQRIGASPLAVMQNLYVVKGKPGWSAQFIIASLNTCGRYSPLRFEISNKGKGDNYSCVAWAYDLDNDNERIEGPAVTIAMAKAEGWYQKPGSKWQTMPDVMIRYRAASFFGKLYAPEIMMGMQTAEELHDIIDVTPNRVDEQNDVGNLNAAIEKETTQKLNEPPPANVDTETGEVMSAPITQQDKDAFVAEMDAADAKRGES